MTDVILSGRHGREVFSIHPVLAAIMTESVLPNWPANELVITCIYRSPEEDQALNASGIHAAGPPYRAIDIRIRNLHTQPDQAQTLAEAIAEIVNSEWDYDPTRPRLNVAVAKPHGTGSHMHIQCFPGRTQRKG